MLTIAIREKNSHFTHGIKIIVANVCQHLKQDFCFLSPEHHKCADIVFLSLYDNWVTAECYQMPKATKSQRIILICRQKEHQNLMFRPCLYMLPVIFREDEIDEIIEAPSRFKKEIIENKTLDLLVSIVNSEMNLAQFYEMETELVVEIMNRVAEKREQEAKKNKKGGKK